MKVKELEEFTRKCKTISKSISCYEQIQRDKEKDLHRLDIDDEDEEEQVLEELHGIKKELKELESHLKELEPSIPTDGIAVFNRSMLGTEVAKLMSEILGKNYVYQEDYVFEIDDGSDMCREFRHIDVLKKKVHTIVEEKYQEHDIYIDYYDREKLDLSEKGSSDYWLNDDFHVNDFEKRIKNKELFVLPDSCLLHETEKENYRKGNIVLPFSACETLHPYGHDVALIEDYNCWVDGYSDIINNFLLTVLIKGLYIGKTLNKEEIAKVRTKFIELYKSGYDFEYYEDELFNLEDVKVLEKNIENNREI